jgi:hypothetical protein
MICLLLVVAIPLSVGGLAALALSRIDKDYRYEE